MELHLFLEEGQSLLLPLHFLFQVRYLNLALEPVFIKVDLVAFSHLLHLGLQLRNQCVLPLDCCASFLLYLHCERLEVLELYLGHHELLRLSFFISI